MLHHTQVNIELLALYLPFADGSGCRVAIFCVGFGWSRATYLTRFCLSLAGVAQWIEHQPANRKVMPGLWARSLVGGVQEATD